ncbi:MAG TPA: FAD-dependent oxidoreductase [Thermoanaerobaculia bacterium]|nr:FAD-dependent oxidoreductase [Thermoanaerobaculia bacterium]
MKIAIVGSGFAGSILARILAIQGHRVQLLDRQRHPRFALGESSTPLAAICLERLAARYGLDDLHTLAAWGRWRKRLPHLRRGLKRGFTFYGHSPGRPYENGESNERRLLVAASPDDGIADCHWLRADVDHHLVLEAGRAGVEILEEVELNGVEARNGWHLTGTHHGQAVLFEADLLIDASGPGGFLARHLPIERVETEPHTTLVFGHFEGMADFSEVTGGAALPEGSYPDEQAAVHHILKEGWMYVLPFDHGTVSAGFVIADGRAREELASLSPDQAWAHLLARYPTLRDQFASAAPARPIGKIPRLQHRLARAAGDGWALLPHAYCFLSPLFSTGIAWSLLAVERLAFLLEQGPEGLQRYGDLLSLEADHIQKLVAGAYATMGDFDRFAAGSLLYFAAASFAEASQRLLPGPVDGWAWSGFLGSTDPVVREMLDRVLAGLQEPGFEEKIRQIIAPRNLAGLADPARNRLYPVDLEPLIEGAGLLGLTTEEIRREIPRLRGTDR